MKKHLLMFTLLFSSLWTLSQKIHEKELPVKVHSAFQKQFPDVKDAKWEKEGTNFEAEFDLNKTEQSVVFDDQGTLLETEVEIKVDQLPKGVSEYVGKHYNGQKVKEAAKITDAKNMITYEAEIKGLDLIFDADGNFVKEKKD